MYITYDKNNKRVAYMGDNVPISYSDTLKVAFVESCPNIKKDHYLVYNEETNTVEQVPVPEE